MCFVVVVVAAVSMTAMDEQNLNDDSQATQVQVPPSTMFQCDNNFIKISQ